MKTYGKVVLESKRWMVTCEPHVMMRLKRAFPKVSPGAFGSVLISDTVPTCRDLEWFLERYPMEFPGIGDKEYLKFRSQLHRDQEDVVYKLLQGKITPTKFDLALPPRHYQQVAADMALASKSLLIADDVGLGKTCTSLCVLSNPQYQPALVVTLTHLPRQWQNEVAKFLPGARSHIIQNGPVYDLTLGPKLRKRDPYGLHRPLFNDLPHIIIISYSKLAKWAETLAPVIKAIVFDEVQELRRGTDSEKGKAAYHIANSAELRIGLSATPIYNYGGELFNVLEAIAPGALGSQGEFFQEWGGGGYDDRIRDPKALGTYLRETGLMLRRTRSEVGKELPPVNKIIQEVDCDSSALDAIKSSAAELARIILDQQPQSVRGQKMQAATDLSGIVRQATGISKAPYVADFVRMLIESGEKKIVLYGWHRAVYDIWLDRLSDLDPVLYTGSESPKQKQDAFEKFVKGDAKVLIMSLRAGAGLDGLQEVCRTIVYGELDWSPGVHEQCTGRVARDGLTDSAFIYYLISSGGSDPIVSDVLGLKKSQIEGIRDPNQELVEELSVDPDHIKKLARAYLRVA